LKEVRDKRCDVDSFQSEGTRGYSVLELPHSRSAVYRLVGAGPGGSAVIAKRCYHKHSESAATEHIIYERVLPRLPISALHYYGLVDDDSDCRWLFLEDAGDESYASEIGEHRALAGRWLGAMNTSAQPLAVGEDLPDRGAAFYLEGLRRARAMIIDGSSKNLSATAIDWERFGLLSSGSVSAYHGLSSMAISCRKTYVFEPSRPDRASWSWIGKLQAGGFRPPISRNSHLSEVSTSH